MTVAYQWGGNEDPQMQPVTWQGEENVWDVQPWGPRYLPLIEYFKQPFTDQDDPTLAKFTGPEEDSFYSKPVVFLWSISKAFLDDEALQFTVPIPEEDSFYSKPVIAVWIPPRFYVDDDTVTSNIVLDDDSLWSRPYVAIWPPSRPFLDDDVVIQSIILDDDSLWSRPYVATWAPVRPYADDDTPAPTVFTPDEDYWLRNMVQSPGTLGTNPVFQTGADEGYVPPPIVTNVQTYIPTWRPRRGR